MNADPVIIERATDRDRDAVLALLRASNLPPDGLAGHWRTVLVGRAGAQVVGIAAVECHGEHGLLRSVAVAKSRRGEGLGERLTRAALDLARTEGVSTLYLLTETADRFFPRFGFRVIRRADVDEAVMVSAEFRGACPDTAVAMELVLGLSGSSA